MLGGIAAFVFPEAPGYALHRIRVALGVRKSTEGVCSELAAEQGAKWERLAHEHGLTFPFRGVTLVGLKEERRLEVWALGEKGGAPVFLKSYPVLGASGVAGPKLREGDRQVPEGIYRLTGLNPNSAFHLSMRVNYPNEFDKSMAREEGRSGLGGDIFIHGRSASIGCLAMGDAPIEELFFLACRVGVENVTVLLAPWDLRVKAAPGARGEESAVAAPWASRLYGPLTAAMRTHRRPE